MRRTLPFGLLALCIALVPATRVRAEPKKDLPFLIKNLAADPSPKVRAQCAAAIEKLGAEGKPAGRTLCRALLDPAKNVREAALNALERVDPDLHLPVARLLEKRVGNNHLKAVQTIAKMKKDGNPATPLLRLLLYATLQEHYLLTVKGRQLQTADAMRKEQAKNQNNDDILELLQGIVNGMLNDLQDEVDSNDMEFVKTRLSGLPDLIRADMQALVQVAGNETAVAKSIAVGLKSPEAAFRIAAVKALGDMDKANASMRTQTRTAIAAALKDPAADVRQAAIEALAGFGEHAKKYVALLKKMQAKDPAEEVRQAAGKAIHAIAEP